MAAQRQLANALRELNKEPIEGFCVELTEEEDLFRWRIYLEGPQDSPYEGGIFQAIMKFPPEYPMLPPSLTFTSSFWHPNVYADGRVCISILHPPGEDPMSGELPEERWLPTQTVGTILLSVISMLNDPNTSSPANVDASVMWRNDRETYNKKCARLVAKANKEVPEGVVIPHPESNPEEKQKQLERKKALEAPVDFFDDDDDSDDEFFPDSNDDDDNSVISAFYDSDEGSAIEPLPVDGSDPPSEDDQEPAKQEKSQSKSPSVDDDVSSEEKIESPPSAATPRVDEETSNDSEPDEVSLEEPPLKQETSEPEEPQKKEEQIPAQREPAKQQEPEEKKVGSSSSSKEGKKKGCAIM